MWQWHCGCVKKMSHGSWMCTEWVKGQNACDFLYNIPTKGKRSKDGLDQNLNDH